MQKALQDIGNRDDIQRIITVFYSQLLTDPIIGFFFTDLVQLDLDKHIPKITDFWAFHLLSEKNYRGNVFEAHLKLHRQAAMTEDHFHRWVFVLHNTIDALYAGPIAEAMKLKAGMIAQKMQQALASGVTNYDITEGVQMMTPPAPFT
ncbi:MAG TPA: group III truncated hemoglobin [Pseudomonadales bacterium]|nr:group III truncated hemoglobin [Pseudomonadales bacterium]